MSKKYLSAAFAYVGVIVGAGLASGQDLLQYFLAYGAIGLIGVAALGVLNVHFWCSRPAAGLLLSFR